ncbi:hypothetical protein SOVF_147740 [Spinacia oleracea]|nr:hypothetical protein SOVF_147740 [Spinacia oleracea]
MADVLAIDRVVEMDNMDDDKKNAVGTFKKKAMNASSKFKSSFSRRRRSSKVMSVDFVDIHDFEEAQAVESLRQALILEELLPSKFDDYHVMLRKRHFFLTDEILKANPSMLTYGDVSHDARREMTIEYLPKLGKEAGLKAIKEWGQPKSQITHLIVYNTLALSMPGADYELAKALELEPTVHRTVMYLVGCHAGPHILRHAKDIAENNKGSRILIVCAETTTVNFHGPSETHIDSLVGQALFGDGAAAVIDNNKLVSPNSLVAVVTKPKPVDDSWHKMVNNNNYAIVKADCYTINSGFKPPEGISNQIVAGLMAFIMGIVTMVRLTRTMPKKMTDANIYGPPMYCFDSMAKAQGHEIVAPGISNVEFMTVIKRMAAMEEKLMEMAVKPDVITEKEEMLQVASNRVDALEHELSATKKALEDALSKQEELLAFMEKKKKKKKMFAW